MEQVLDDWRDVSVAFLSRILVERPEADIAAGEKEAYAIVIALSKCSGYITLHLVTVCNHCKRTTWTPPKDQPPKQPD